jgi:hypothetical protein
MKIIANEKLIKRNNRIGQITSIGSLVVLAVGMFYSFKDSQGTYMTFTFTTLILGFILFQVGNFYLNRFGKSPRPDELISQSLKGLDDHYSLYHYTTDVSHLLVGPAGVYSILPYGQEGTLYYDANKKQWRQKGGNFFMKVFGQEGMGRPVGEAEIAREELERYLLKVGVGKEKVTGSPVLLFTNERATIEGEGSPVPYTTSEKFKDFIRRKAKEADFDAEPVIELIEQKRKK